MSTSVLTIRVSESLKEKLESLAKAMDRSKSWVAIDALEKYIELQEWQIREIEEGIKQADTGEFADEEQVDAFFKKWHIDEDSLDEESPDSAQS